MSVTGVAAVVDHFRKTAEDIDRKVTEPARLQAEALRARIEARAPGHLGRNWEITVKDGQAYLSNDAVDWHRYEYGFQGTDALGRVVDQPPRPIIRPAMSGSGQAFMDRLAKLFT